MIKRNANFNGTIQKRMQIVWVSPVFKLAEQKTKSETGITAIVLKQDPNT